MFDKPYLDVNREERFYCALFFHAILSSKMFRRKLFSRIQDLTGLELDVDAYEVFYEITMLRDYWNDLGDPKAYSAETHSKRFDVVRKILKYFSLDEINIESSEFMQTCNKKLWYPGHWSKGGIKEHKYRE